VLEDPVQAETIPQGERTNEKRSPVTGQVLGHFPIATTAEVHAAVARARQAAPAWKSSSIEGRMRLLMRIKDVLRTHGEEYARRIGEDTGKPHADALMSEMLPVLATLDYYSKNAEKTLGRKKQPSQILFPAKTSYVEHQAIGVVAVISPWNFPFNLAIIPVISALISGNTVVLKPSEVTPITGEVVREIFARIGLPIGVVEVVQGDGGTGAALCEAQVDKIFFTGSVATGRKVMAAAAKRPIPVELELGGKDAMIVLSDANLKRAAKAAVWGGLLNCGQACVSVERILVEASVHDRFVELLRTEVANVRVGGPDEDADMGPMIFGRQIETVERHVEDAKKRGAKVLLGGQRLDRPGQFFAPTLLTNVTPGMAIYDDETFGPVLPVVKVQDEDEAIRLANDHQYGLNGSVWTRDIKRGLALASRLECGQATVNDLIISVGNPALPFGGVKNSGFGRYHGPEGLLTFTQPKAIMVDRGLLDSEPFWFPFRGKYGPMKDAFDALAEGRMTKLVGAFVKLARVR
jgi:acyl-CoA reductase-like NAD-dependent aldehyde dehydrogenase